MPAKVTAYIALGSNLNNPTQQIANAVDNLKQEPTIELQKTSSIYKSHPLGPQDQPDFYNAVCAIQTTIPPLILLDICQKIEAKQQRMKTRYWGERTIDLDILLYGEKVLNNKKLVIPHPQMKNRLFVLLPLLEITTQLKLPDKTDLANLVEHIVSSTSAREIPTIFNSQQGDQ